MEIVRTDKGQNLAENWLKQDRCQKNKKENRLKTEKISWKQKTELNQIENGF